MAVEFVQVCRAVEFVGSIEIERAGIAFDHKRSGLATDSIVPGRTGRAVEHEGTGRAVGTGEFDSANKAFEFERTGPTMAVESVAFVCTGMVGKSEHRLAIRVRRFRAHRYDCRVQAHLHGPDISSLSAQTWPSSSSSPAWLLSPFARAHRQGRRVR